MLVDAVPRIDLANLIEELKTKSRESLLEAVEAYQERLLDELCGEKRKPNSTYRRAGSGRRLKTIVTTLGVVRFRTLKVKNHATGETLTPILDILDVRGRKYTRQVKVQSAMRRTNQQAELWRYSRGVPPPHRVTGTLHHQADRTTHG